MNILIVESENDQYFVEALAHNANNQVWHIDKFEHSSLDETKLSTKIGSALTTDGVQKIGILLDMDESNEKERIALINRSLKKTFKDNFDENLTAELSKTSEFITINKDEYTPVEISCFFTNVNEKGELETILKEIANRDNAVFADCLLDGWRTCFEQKGKVVVKKGQAGGDITDKELLKFWVDVYKRFDTLKKGERNQETTDWKGIWLGYESKGKKITERGSRDFDLDSPLLTEMKTFLALFA
jgi:hypothetical protein